MQLTPYGNRRSAVSTDLTCFQSGRVSCFIVIELTFRCDNPKHDETVTHAKVKLGRHVASYVTHIDARYTPLDYSIQIARKSSIDERPIFLPIYSSFTYLCEISVRYSIQIPIPENRAQTDCPYFVQFTHHSHTCARSRLGTRFKKLFQEIEHRRTAHNSTYLFSDITRRCQENTYCVH